MVTRSRCVLAAAVAVSGLALAGCATGSSSLTGSSSPAASSSASGASRSPAQAAPAAAGPAASASPSGSKMGIDPGGPMDRPTPRAAECTTAQLKVAYTDNAQIRNGALDGMSHADSVITFTNVGSAPCQTQGYPGVAALDTAGHQIRQAARGVAANGLIPQIVLAPGQVASAEITGNTASCTSLTKVAAFLITAPDQRTSIRLAGARELCLNSLGIGPLERGNAAGLPL